jgi:dihydrophenazinedicarboxylate synthase
MQTARSESLTGTIVIPFPEYDDPPVEPMPLLRKWLASAHEVGVREPRALSLATAARLERLSSRIVVISSVTDEGLRFASHRCSRKAEDLAANPHCSGLLYWRETRQQIVVNGQVTMLSELEADRSWFARPVQTHPMSVVAQQSAPLFDVAGLRAAAQRLERLSEPLPRPDSYRVFEIGIDGVEFWSDGNDRLHERLMYRRLHDDWAVERLQP